MKKIYYILLSFFIISLTSCNFFFGGQLIEEDDSQNIEYDYLELHGNQELVLTGRICISGAVPSELVPANSNNNARTAIPTAPAAFTYKYKINDGTYSTLIVAADNSFSIVLPRTDASVTVTVQAFTAASSSTPLLEGSITIPQTNYADSLNDNITLEPIPTGTGTVRLAVTTDVANAVTCWAYWSYPDGTGDNQSFSITPGTTGYFTMGNDPSVPAHAYEVNFIFQDANNTIVYRCFEKVNVFGTLETDKWLNNGSIHIDAAAEDGKGSLHINQTCIDVFKRTEFFVSNTGNFQNTGTYFDPVDFTQALRLINSINDGTSLYTIYVKDNITASADYSEWPKLADGTTPADSFITIDPAANLKLKIASYGNPATPYKIDANRSVDYPGRVMYVGAKAEVTLENITVTGGCSKLHGAGIIISSGTLTMNAKSSITNNSFSVGGKSGAGIYCEFGSITMNAGAEISYNGNTTNLANGGGIYLKGSDTDLTKKAVIKMESGSKIHHNIGYSGAGLKILYGSDSYFHGAEITDNEAIYATDDNGGGVWASILSGNSLEITDTILKNNTVNCGTTGGGGAIYVHLGRVVINGTTTFENNSGVTGNAIRMLNSSNQHIVLSDSVKFDNTTVKQTIAYNYSSETGAPYIKLGTLTGTVADQTVYLTISPLTEGNPVLIQDSAAVNIADYADRFIVLNTDLTPSGYKIDSNGKLAEKVAKGPNGGNASSAYTDVVPFGDGTGITTAGNYSISTKEELTAFATWATTNATTNYTFVLYDNIDLEDIPFSPIGGTKNFAGTFDGNGNKITGLSINSSSQYTGLFGRGGACTIKNLYVEGNITSSAGTIGGIIGTTSAASAVIDNCVSNINITCTSGGSVGGIIGSAGSPVTNCINLGNITGSSGGSCVGGIAGTSGKNIINCANFGAVTGHMNVAGICGQLDANGIANCYNYGKITADSSFGAIEGKGSAGPFSELYYHPNSGVIAAVYNKADNIDDDIGTFTDPDALRLTLNTNLQNPAYSSLSLLEWKYNYKIDGVKYPVCTTFALPEKIGVNLSDLASAPLDNSVPYIIKTQSDIEKLAGWVNSGLSFAGFEFKIPEEVSDIDLSGNWTPIGTSGKPFRGTFDGGNVAISSVAISGGKGSGFFGYVENAIIRNVKLDGSLTVTGADCGGLAGSASGNILIENCDIKMVVNGGSNNDIGGVLGFYDGDSSSNITIRNCINRSSITGTSNIGGIVGLIYSVATNPNLNVIENCANYGGVTGTGSNVGGIAGQINKTKIENCLSNPTNVISGTTNVGNVCGNASTGCEVNYCYYLTNNPSDEKYCGNSTITPTNCNIFRVMENKYQVYNAGNSVIGSYSANADLCDIMNDWVNYKNTTSPGYLSWKYESSLMEFVE